MADATSSRPQVNGILETSLYVERPTQSVEFYRRVFGFEPIDTDQKEGITDETRLCAMRAGDRSILLLFKKGVTANTDATLTAEILSWSRSRGLFAGVALEGATLRNDLDENKEMYGQRWTAKEILGSGAKIPAGAQRLIASLNKYSPRRTK